MKFIRYCFIFIIITLLNLISSNNSFSIEIDTNSKIDALITTILAAEKHADSLTHTPVYKPIINKNILIQEFKPYQININFNYPEISHAPVDHKLAMWAENFCSNFVNDTNDMGDSNTNFTLDASYEVSRPSQFIISIVFTVGIYTGGAHPNSQIICLNYDLKSGELLNINNIFGDLKAALNIMSKFSHKKLQIDLGEYLNEEMLNAGTYPIIENYSALALIPAGINIYFQPYQVAPYAAGISKIYMSLEELRGAKPRDAIWNINNQ